MTKKDLDLASQIFMGVSVVCVVLAGIGYMGTDIWLASTQWMIVAAVFALFGIYTRMSKKS